ncbi:sugar-binding transcriptional regulator [Pseudonocardia sp.]|uniref:sugar-binding transcriptional regulator n=1 Tax=Pseudonocardia sp. TaxID=60912 RepID=UPI003D147CA0
MVTRTAPGPAQLVLMASLARRYFLEGRSKVEIAEEFRLSRFKVARLLDASRESGMVHIEIRQQREIDVDLSARLQERFGLAHAIVLNTPDTPDDPPDSLRRHLGRAAAELLGEICTASDVLGLAWARSVSAMAAALPRLPGVPVVQLTGVLSMPDDDRSSVDAVRDVARASGGPAYVFYAPFTVPDASTAQALRRQPEVARALGYIPSVTRAVGGLGQWAPGQSTLHDAAAARDRRELRRLGVVAELAGVFLDADGQPVRTELSERIIGVTAEQLRRIPEVIVIPYGTVKAPAVLAALRSGLVGGVVTHASLAHHLLAPEE